MRTSLETTTTATVDRIDHVRMAVSAIHPMQSRIVNRLHPKLDRHILILGNRLDHVQHRIWHTVRSSADREPDDFWITRHRQIVNFSQLIDRRVSIGSGLKVRDEPLDFGVSMANGFDSRRQLLANLFQPNSTRWAE